MGHADITGQPFQGVHSCPPDHAVLSLSLVGGVPWLTAPADSDKNQSEQKVATHGVLCHGEIARAPVTKGNRNPEGGDLYLG